MPPKGRGRGRGGGDKKQPERPGGKPPAEAGKQPAAQKKEHAAQRPAAAPQPPPPQERAAQRPAATPQPPPPREPIVQQAELPEQAQASGEPVDIKIITKGVQRLGSMYYTSDDMPAKPSPGTLGRKIRLIANHFNVQMPDGYVYHYDVDIDPVPKGKAGMAVPTKKKGPPTGRKLNSRICRKVVDKLLRDNKIFRSHLPAYDGHKNIITRKPLPLKKLEVFLVDLVEDDKSTSQFKVSIQPVEKEEVGSCAISLDVLHHYLRGQKVDFPQEAIMALDIVLRHGPALRQVQVQRSFFTPPRQGTEAPYLGLGREVWFGYYQSLRPGQWKPMLNIDKSATAFFTAQSVLDFIAEIIKQNVNHIVNLDAKQTSEVTKELKGVQIEVTHLSYPRKYRVLRLTHVSASQLTFEITNPDQSKKKTSVAQYFKDVHHKPLHFPHLPCIQAQPEEKRIYLPVEVCKIVGGQQSRKKLTEKQTAEMIKFTATRPQQRFDDIKRAVRTTIESSGPYLREFGIQIDPEPLRLNGRVIQPPNVLYKSKTAAPYNGAWDLKDQQFFAGARIPNWILLNFSGGYCRDEHIKKFVEMLCKIGRELGMEIANPLNKVNLGRDRRSESVILHEVKTRYPDIMLAVVVLGRNSVYANIKHAAEIKEGIQTQCIKDENVVKKCNAQLIVNLLQKINAKVEGVNCSLVPQEKPSVFRRPVIIFGADVTHPAPGDKLKPSVAAVVASMDSYPCRYVATVRVQRNRDREENKPLEIIEQLDEMVKELLMCFYRRTRHKPEKIIFYRDGVSEGQFAQVQQKELLKLRNACSSLQKDYEPPITFIVVQKRHHTRFMPENPRDGTGKCANIPPGTTVDTDVVNPVNFDFFLCSHAGIQGTSRPAHYTALWDDNGFTADELQKLTFHLCHTYVRCTRSISIPAPVMYAHLAAFRARNHIISSGTDTSSDSGSSGESLEVLSDDILNSVVVVQALKEQMYFA